MQLSGAIAGRLFALSLALLWELPSEVRLLRIPAGWPRGFVKVEQESALLFWAALSQTDCPTFQSRVLRVAPSFQGKSCLRRVRDQAVGSRVVRDQC